MDPSTRRGFVKRAAMAAGGVAASVSSAGAESGAQAGARPASKTERLRALLQTPDVTVVPEAYSVFTARLAEINGFDAIYVDGNMMAGMYLGIEDWGLIDTSELVEIGGRIARGVSVPAIVDCDQGGETALNVYRSVGAYERAGIAGLHIEDTRNPKHMGPGRSELMPLDEMLVRISAAVDARTDPNFVIIARSDCLILGPNRGDADEAIRRGTAFAEAGADAFFCVAMRSEQVGRIANEVPIPLIALNVPVPDVKDTRLKMDIHAVSVYPAAAKLYETMILELKDGGQFDRREDRRLSRETVERVLNIPEYRTLADEWMKLGE